MRNVQRVLVAGGAGFVGSAVVRALLDNRLPVLCVDNFLFGAAEHVSDLTGDLDVVELDLLDREALLDLVRSYRPTHAINCVGDTFVPDCYVVPRRFFENNLMACLNLLEVAREARLSRVVYLSSTEVYAPVAEGRIAENAPLNPVNTYAVSKLASDRLCYTYGLEHQLEVIIARVFNCYGPRATHPYVIPEIIAQLARGPVVDLGDVDTVRDFTFVDDTAMAITALLDGELQGGEVVNIGSGVGHSIRSLVERIGRLMGFEEVEIRLDRLRLRRCDIPRFCCDPSKLSNRTGWRPAVTLDDGLQRTIDWYFANGCRWRWEARERVCV